jgi:hypothetical protein
VIVHPVMLSKELDAFYHIFIDLLQKIEREVRVNQLASTNLIQGKELFYI